MTFDCQKLTELLIEHEGLRLKPYRCPSGKLTIGVGRNLEDVGITKAEAMFLLANDIKRVSAELNAFDWFKGLDPVRQLVLMDMCFNLGLSNLLKFKKMISALERGDYDKAHVEMLDSLWATQVGSRAWKLAKMMKHGTMEGQ